MPHVKVIAQKASKIHAEVVVAGFFQDDRPLAGLCAELDWIHGGIISHMILRGKIHGNLKETALLATQRKLHAHKILLIGLGKKTQSSLKTLQDVYSHIARTLLHLHVKDCAVEVFHQAGFTSDNTRILETVLMGLGAASGQEMEISLLVPDEEKAQRMRQRVQEVTGTHD
jgi:Cytosol aminopeptidase family, N-terminal domain